MYKTKSIINSKLNSRTLTLYFAGYTCNEFMKKWSLGRCSVIHGIPVSKLAN